MNAFLALAAAVVAAAASGCATPPAPPSPVAASERANPTPAPAPSAPPAATETTNAPPNASGPVRPRSEPSGSLPAVELSPQLLYQVLAAEIASQRGEIGAAWSTYLNMARSTRDPRLARRAAELAVNARALDEALQAARLWRELAPDSEDANRLLEAIWASSGRIDNLDAVLTERLAQARREGTLDATYAQLQRMLARVSDRQAAWSALERLSAPDLDRASARLARAQTAAAAGQTASAALEANEAMRKAPTDAAIWASAAQILYRIPDQRAAALQALEDFLRREPGATELRSTYARLLMAEGRLDEARAQFERLLSQLPDPAEALLSLAQLAYDAKQGALASDYLQKFIALPSSAQRDTAPALVFLAQIAEEAGQMREALRWLEQVPPGDSFFTATIRRALLLGKQGQVEDARALLRNTETRGAAERARLFSAEAEVLRNARRNDDALVVLTQGLEQLPDQPDLLYDHGMAAERVNRIDLMEVSLRRLIALRPDHAHAYNALGYTLADRNLRLDEARALIERAVALAPQDAHILDSLGWVLFRQNELTKAIDTLRRAYSMLAEADIAAHLGEALWVQGNREEALRIWREARGRDPENATLRETLTRLNVAL